MVFDPSEIIIEELVYTQSWYLVPQSSIGVKVTHIPTGCSCSSQDPHLGRFANKEIALRRLESKVSEFLKKNEEAKKEDNLRRAVYCVLEGYTLPDSARKILEAAYFSDKFIGDES